VLGHPEVELARVASVDRVGEPLASAHPNLEGRTELVFEDLSAVEAAEGMDVVLFGLPHDVSAREIPEVLERHEVKVVDMSGAFRCADAAAYARWYGAPHPRPELLGTFAYGLPELGRERIRAAGRVASPGCFATTIELSLLPLARRGWLGGAVDVVAMTGSSGSGAAPSAGTHHPVRAVNLKSYKTLAHPQQPEIEETLTGAGAERFHLSFVPVSAPLSRGLFATCFARIPARLSEAEVRRAYEDAYGDERFVRIPRRRQPEVAAVAGSNYAEVGWVLGGVQDGLRTLTALSALDNLVKGGAGQAVQNMNLVLGLEEHLALEDPGSWP
jgi:N-acetyl-gamma-glutamyl-phosphate reductase